MYNRTVLDSGIRILSMNIPHSETVSVGLWIPVGSAVEKPHESGFTHFIEHMLFKGTNQYTAYDIARLVDGVGGIMNAFTSRYSTCIYINVMADEIDLVLDLLYSMYYDSLFSEAEMDRERQVILQEIYMYEDTPDDIIYDYLLEDLWPGHPVSRYISGDCQAVQNTTRDNLIKYFNDMYTSDRTIISVAGKFDQTHLQKKIESWPKRVSDEKKRVQQPLPALKEGRFYHKKELEQVHLLYALPGIPKAAPDRFSFLILNMLLGGSMSSRLYQSLREQDGYCYTVYSSTMKFNEQGLMTVYSATTPEMVPKLEERLHYELDRVFDAGISLSELQQAKRQAKGNIILGRQSVEAHMNRLAALEMIYGRFISDEEVIQSIEAVTMDDMNKIISKTLDPAKRSVCLVGPDSREGSRL